VDVEDRILLELEMSDALRPGESFALRWKCFDSADSSLSLQETVYKGKIRKWGKTKKSMGRIHIPPLMVSDLLAWKIICPDASPEAFIVPNRDGGFLDPNNYRKRVLGSLRGIPRFAQADVPGDSADDRDTEPNEGHTLKA